MIIKNDCPLCATEGGRVLWRSESVRIICPDEPLSVPVVRVIYREHICEWSDLEPEARVRLLQAVEASERMLRALTAPDKINLASLGNLVPHMHWHIIARYRRDAWFPDPIWGNPRREAATVGLDPEQAIAWLARWFATSH